MKKSLLWIIVLVLSISMIAVFSFAGCKAEKVAAKEEEVAEEEEEVAEEPTQGSLLAEYNTTEWNTDFEIVIVTKIENIPWFDMMHPAEKKFTADTGVKVWQTGPTESDSVVEQIAIIEDLITRGVDAIIVVPNDPDALIPVFKKANDAGILTFTHEASSQKQISYDIEAFDNASYGAHMMDVLAELMGKEGKYACFVGFLTSVSHNEWVDAEIARAEEAYPNMVNVLSGKERIESSEKQQTAYEETLDLLKKYPDLGGLLGSSANDVPGIAIALEEQRAPGQVKVVGTCIPSMASDSLVKDYIQSIHFWDAGDAAYAACMVAWMMLNGKEPKPGMDLGADGYEDININGTVIYGKAWVDVTKENYEDYPV